MVAKDQLPQDVLMLILVQELFNKTERKLSWDSLELPKNTIMALLVVTLIFNNTFVKCDFLRKQTKC